LKVSPKQAYMQRTTVRESNMVVDDINEHLDLQHTQYIGRLERHLAYKASKVPITYFIEGEAVVVLTYNAHAKRSSQKAKKIVGIAKVVEVLANDRYHVQWLFNGNPPYAIKGKRSEKSYPHYCLKKVAKHMSLERLNGLLTGSKKDAFDQLLALRKCPQTGATEAYCSLVDIPVQHSKWVPWVRVQHLFPEDIIKDIPVVTLASSPMVQYCGQFAKSTTDFSRCLLGAIECDLLELYSAPKTREPLDEEEPYVLDSDASNKANPASLTTANLTAPPSPQMKSTVRKEAIPAGSLGRKRGQPMSPSKLKKAKRQKGDEHKVNVSKRTTCKKGSSKACNKTLFSPDISTDGELVVTVPESSSSMPPQGEVQQLLTTPSPVQLLRPPALPKFSPPQDEPMFAEDESTDTDVEPTVPVLRHSPEQRLSVARHVQFDNLTVAVVVDSNTRPEYKEFKRKTRSMSTGPVIDPTRYNEIPVKKNTCANNSCIDNCISRGSLALRARAYLHRATGERFRLLQIKGDGSCCYGALWAVMKHYGLWSGSIVAREGYSYPNDCYELRNLLATWAWKNQKTIVPRVRPKTKWAMAAYDAAALYDFPERSVEYWDDNMRWGGSDQVLLFSYLFGISLTTFNLRMGHLVQDVISSYSETDNLPHAYLLWHTVQTVSFSTGIHYEVLLPQRD
jgi:hypothetical protein